MATKLENEITVRVIGTREELINCLEKEGFVEKGRFSLTDCYFIPRTVDVKSLSVREILKHAVLLRTWVRENKTVYRITYKNKEIDSFGNILSQEIINCDVYNLEDAEKLLKVIGYYEVMSIHEDDIVFCKNGFEIAIKFIENDEILIEIETKQNTNWDTIEKIKDILAVLNLPIDREQYFVKKAENQLKKVLKRENH